MVRCEEFYKKVEKEGTDWCKKAPQTAARITRYVNDLMPELRAEIANSEVLSSENIPIGQVLSEGASRSLVSEKNPEVREKVVEHIVKLAEEKVMDGEKPNITGPEVKEIVDTIKGESVQEIESAKCKFETPQVFDPMNEYICECGVSFKPYGLDSWPVACPGCGRPDGMEIYQGGCPECNLKVEHREIEGYMGPTSKKSV